MPGIAQKVNNSSDDCNETNTNYHNPLVENGMLRYNSVNGSSGSNNGFWSKHRNDVSYNQLQKFWCELTPEARHKLLRVDKQTLFEQARKNMYCSRCNGLLLEGFMQIVMYGKSLQQDAAGANCGGGSMNNQNDADLSMTNGCQDDVLDPSVHPWGGLTTIRDGMLTLLDCYLYSKSLKGLQHVFDSARARERERKLLYPDACGGGGRGWISQGMAGYGRGHGTRETCALHTARLSVETLVDFWSALGEETRQSLLRMKEEDFIERLMFRFECKKFCKDCRRNVIREFKELKELKRMRREPRCTSWFCVADTAFEYEVSHDTVQADWHQTFLDAVGIYHHFEWAIGTGEGKSDILQFENVGLSGQVQANGLDLGGLNACYITLRAWKIDGRCNELCVKAHALRGQQCVHCKLMVGDGYITIMRGESIRRFFEHAEEAEEEEDDDSVDKDGNELDGECSRPQKHAKSPELAREFLLDAATVIFKEQVEKAFREGTARQNAHSIFVCLALKLLEERVHVACKEIITLEKQMKLLEEEEREKREEEERRERRRAKEREKKLRRKERLREKENKEKKCAESSIDPAVPDVPKDESPPSVDEDTNIEGSGDSVSETGETARPMSSDIQDDQLSMEYIYPNIENQIEDTHGGELNNNRDRHPSLPYDRIKYSRRRLRFPRDPQQDLTSYWSDKRRGSTLSENEVIINKCESRFHAVGFESTRTINGFNKQPRINAAKSNTRNGCSKLGERCIHNRIGDRYDTLGCSCNHQKEYRTRPEPYTSRTAREFKNGINGRPKSKITLGSTPMTKKVWEPLDSQKKYGQSNQSSDVALRSTSEIETSEPDQLPELSGAATSDEVREISVQPNNEDKEDSGNLTMCNDENSRDIENGFCAMKKSQIYSINAVDDGQLCSMARSTHRKGDSSMSNSSNSDNYSCLSEGDSNTSSTAQNLESASSSDTEVSSKNSQGKETSHRLESRSTECERVVEGPRRLDSKSHGPPSEGTDSMGSLPTEATYCESGRTNVSINAQPPTVLPQMHNQSIHYPIFQAPTVGYYHQSPVSWPAGPTNGLMPFTPSNHYMFNNTYGYDLNGSTQFLQYGSLQHLGPPLCNPHHVPIFTPVVQATGFSTKEHASVGLLKEVHHGAQKDASTEQHCAEIPAVGEGGRSDQTDKPSNDFSLFHFGGPVALSTGFKEGIMGNHSVKLSDNTTDGNQLCNKKDNIEEYNLFSAKNGIKFSIF